MDYYEVLGILRSATDQDIRRTYRQLALKHHPDRNPTSKEESSRLFQQISEAYDVLSDSKKRAIYDRFGYEGLHAGIPYEPEGEPWEGYQYKQNSQQIFASFFGTENPFAVFGAEGATPFASRLAAREPKKLPPVTHNLECTLEELYNGAVKRMKITRSRSGVMESKLVSIQVKAGWRAGVKITFPNEGDDGLNALPSDVTFVVQEKPHPSYSVNENELTYTAPMTLMDALSASSINIPTLDGRQISMSIDEVVNPTSVMRIAEEGLMNRDMRTRGSLAVKFNILFPLHLSAEKRRKLRELLNSEATA